MGWQKVKQKLVFYSAAGDCLIENNRITNTNTGVLIGDNKNIDRTGKFDVKKYPSRTLQDVALFNNTLLNNTIVGTKNLVILNEN
jgi:poly(beta-D-mannuronate) lyase